MNSFEKAHYLRARRLYTEGYSLDWIKRYTRLDEETIQRAVQLPFGVHGPVMPHKIFFY